MELKRVIDGLQEKRNEIHKKDLWDDPLELSDVMLRIAVYNSYLADYIAPLHKQASEKQVIEFRKAKEDKKTVGESEMIAKQNSLGERAEYEGAKYLYQANSNLLTVLQSRLRTIQNQRQQEPDTL